MNILFLVNELRYTCGVTNHILHLSRGLAGTGNVKLWIICGGGIGIYRFAGIDVNIISDERFLHSNRSFLGFISAINYLVKFIRKTEIDIIHSHYHYGAAIGHRASQLTGKTTVQTNHGILPDMGKLKHFNADKYIAINEHIHRHILENKIAKEKDVSFIRCGIPVEPEIPQKIINGKLKVLAASRFTYEKGMDIYIRAINMLPDNIFEKASFYIAGEGELNDELKELNSLLSSKVNFAGKILDIYSYLSGTHILVNPSRSGSEGFPAIITEAGASNTLVISSDFTGAEDVIKHGVNGLIYKDNSPDNLCELLEIVIANYDSYIPLSNNFYEFISKEFSIQEMTGKHISLYSKCLA